MAGSLLPQYFIPTTESQGSGIDFYDLISGSGYVEFLGGSLTSTYALSNFEFYSNDLYTSAAGAAGPSKVIDADFDITVNRPLIIQGKGIINATLRVEFVGSAYIVAKVRKYSGATETDIATSANSDNVTCAGAAVTGTLAIDVTIPVTSYKPGDILRLTIEVWTSAAGGNVLLEHDPMNRTTGLDTDYPSKLVFQCPIRIDL